ncbi:MAG: FAD-dependent thymidylate synthase, partial [bacterium]
MKQPNSVELISHSGGDWAHARAAWASTDTEVMDNEERIPGLLRMLAENGHGTPFEHSLLSFRIQSDIASHIHLLKHRAGVSINSESARYKELRRDDFYLPDDWPEEATTEAERIIETLQATYHQMIEGLIASGIPRKR